MADAATDVHSYTGYNKYQNQSTLVGNWVEERALKAATGTHRYKVRRRRWRLAGRVRGQGGGLRARAQVSASVSVNTRAGISVARAKRGRRGWPRAARGLCRGLRLRRVGTHGLGGRAHLPPYLYLTSPC